MSTFFEIAKSLVAGTYDVEHVQVHDPDSDSDGLFVWTHVAVHSEGPVLYGDFSPYGPGVVVVKQVPVRIVWAHGMYWVEDERIPLVDRSAGFPSAATLREMGCQALGVKSPGDVEDVIEFSWGGHIETATQATVRMLGMLISLGFGDAKALWALALDMPAEDEVREPLTFFDIAKGIIDETGKEDPLGPQELTFEGVEYNSKGLVIYTSLFVKGALSSFSMGVEPDGPSGLYRLSGVPDIAVQGLEGLVALGTHTGLPSIAELYMAGMRALPERIATGTRVTCIVDELQYMTTREHVACLGIMLVVGTPHPVQEWIKCGGFYSA